MALGSAWFERSNDHVSVLVPAPARAALSAILDEVRELLVAPDTDLPRLFPTAYPDHPKLDEEYHRYMRSELVESRLAALDGVSRSIEASRLSLADADAWRMSINLARVTVGSLLGVDHDDWTVDELGPFDITKPAFRLYELYELLGFLLYELLDALSGSAAGGGVVEPGSDLGGG